MRCALFLGLGIFLWDGTVSINYPDQSPNATASPTETCSATAAGKRLMSYLKSGKIAGIRDNGRVLSIGLTPQWTDFPIHIQRNVLKTVACYAKTQYRVVQYIATQ